MIRTACSEVDCRGVTDSGSEMIPVRQDRRSSSSGMVAVHFLRTVLLRMADNLYCTSGQTVQESNA